MHHEDLTIEMFPISIWGNSYSNLLSLYRDAQTTPAVTVGGFKSRVRRFSKMHGYIDADAIEVCLNSPMHAFEGGGAVYEIFQRSTGKKYIGITDSVAGRWRQHQKSALQPKTRLQKEMHKHGIDDFEFKILVQGMFTCEVLKRIERALILTENTMWPSGLNSLPGQRC